MSDNEGRHLVRIHVDREPLESPNPTTGIALYALAAIDQHIELFREINGDHEDPVVHRTDEPVHLKLEEHFYSQRVITIIVNLERKQVDKRRLSFDEVVALDKDLPPPGPNILITVDYANGPAQNPKGALRKGEWVWLREGMEFDVSATDRS